MNSSIYRSCCVVTDQKYPCEKTKGKISVALTALFHPQLEQTGLRATGCLCILPLSLIEGVTAFIQGIYLVLALFFLI